jgi:hypothetical protein
MAEEPESAPRPNLKRPRCNRDAGPDGCDRIGSQKPAKPDPADLSDPDPARRRHMRRYRRLHDISGRTWSFFAPHIDRSGLERWRCVPGNLLLMSPEQYAAASAIAFRRLA